MADSPWYLPPLLGALAGGTTGLGSGLLGEHLRAKVLAIRAELKRLDDLHDAIGAAIVTQIGGSEVDQGALHQLSVQRGRLGKNLARLGFHSKDYARVQAGVERLSRVIGDVEDANDDLQKSATLPAALDRETEDLRRAVDSAARRFFMYRALGPGT